jgi:hypothetical protein
MKQFISCSLIIWFWFWFWFWFWSSFFFFQLCRFSLLGLGKNIGQQHWGCCFATDAGNLVCSDSDGHHPVSQSEETNLSGLKKLII